MPDLPKFDEWTAPWEKEGAEPFDADKAKRLVYNALSGQEKAKAKAKESSEALTVVETERDEALESVKTLEEKGLNATQLLELENRRLKEAKDSKPSATPKGDDGDKLEAARLRIALRKGLTEAQAARLHGSTEDELSEDADAYIEEHGITSGGDGKGDDKGGDKPPTNRPASNLKSSLGDTGDKDKSGEYVDPSKVELVARR